MKKLFFAIAAVAMVFATSCKKESVNGAEEPVVAGDNEFICVIDQNANPQNAPMVDDGMGTMAHIDGNNNVWWQAGDQIAYYGQQVDETGQNVGDLDYYTLTCSKMESDGRAYFSDGNKHFGQGSHVAYYPSTLYKGTDGLLLPDVIDLEAGKNAGFLPMYGTGTGTHYLTFHNICAVFKITIPTNVTDCDRIVLHADENLCGTFTISGSGISNDPYYAELSSTANKDTFITINGDFNGTEKNTVYVAVPAKSGDATTPAYNNVYFELFVKDENSTEANPIFNSIYQTPAQNLTRNIEVNKVYPIGLTVPEPLLSGVFSVSATKQVQFTRGNLFWNGANWHMEANQAAYPTTWNENHVGHFYFSDNASGMYGESKPTTTPTGFYFAENNNINVEGATGYYVLSSAEWEYLLDTDYEGDGRDNAMYLTALVELDGAKYLMIAPDNHNYNTKPLSGYTTLSAANNDNIVCLPYVGMRTSTSGVYDMNNTFAYHSSTKDSNCQYYLTYYNYKQYVITTVDSNCGTMFNVAAFAIRLVKIYTGN